MKNKLMEFFNKPFFKIFSFWIIFWALQSILMSGGKHIGFYLQKNIAIVSLQFFVVSINMLLLFPFLFEKKKYISYTLISITLIYLIFSVSFFFIELIFSFSPVESNFSGPYFSTDFWRILSGSSFYSLVLVCSTIYKLLTINKIIEKNYLEIKKQNSREIIVIKEANNSHFVQIEDINFIKGLREYVVWNTKNKKIISLESLKGIESKLKEKGFTRVHKSYIINTKKIDSISSTSLNIKDEIIPIGRKYKDNITSFNEENLSPKL